MSLRQPRHVIPLNAEEDPRDKALRITEIFYSLQGESSTAGWPTVFIRLTGCPLRCVYCDTTYSFTGGETLSVGEILDQLHRYQVNHVCVTGGEPLSQRNVHVLLKQLCDEGYQVSLETSGAIDVSPVDARVVKVMDLKGPSSGEMDRNYWPNVDHLLPHDEVKFVIRDRQDYDWSVEIMERHDLAGRCQVLFSPMQGELEPDRLADWILADQLPVRFQFQLHKYLWGDVKGK